MYVFVRVCVCVCVFDGRVGTMVTDDVPEVCVCMCVCSCTFVFVFDSLGYYGDRRCVRDMCVCVCVCVGLCVC
jgi:hypothetical protein